MEVLRDAHGLKCAYRRHYTREMVCRWIKMREYQVLSSQAIGKVVIAEIFDKVFVF